MRREGQPQVVIKGITYIADLGIVGILRVAALLGIGILIVIENGLADVAQLVTERCPSSGHLAQIAA